MRLGPHDRQQACRVLECGSLQGVWGAALLAVCRDLGAHLQADGASLEIFLRVWLQTGSGGETPGEAGWPDVLVDWAWGTLGGSES